MRSEKSQASWLKINHHGFRWDDGHVPYTMAKNLVRKAIGTDSPLINVKGLEKKKWLCEIADVDLRIETIDLDYEDIEHLKDLNVIGTLRCGYHTRRLRYAKCM